jgi:WD40 repeat protein
MVADVVDRPGGLPLLQYALTELADRDDVHALTLSSYRRIGGVSGALARRAEHLYDGLAEDGRDACRDVFLRLVAIGEGTDARRRVRRSELAADEATHAVIEAFGRHRLLSFDRDPATREPSIEIAHEALLRAWTRLRRWVDEARDDIRTEHQLSLAASEWDAGGQDPSFLVRGARLERFASWAEITSVSPSSLGASYLAAAGRQRDEEVAAARAAQKRERNLERRSLRRTRALVAVLTAGLLIAGTLSVIAVNRNASANRATRLATARELAGKALAAVESDPDLASLLALASIETSAQDDIVVQDAERTLRSLPSLTIDGLGDGGSLEASLTPDLSRVAVVAEHGPTAVWDLASGQPGRRVFVVPTRVAAAGRCPTEPEGVTFPRCDAVFHAALSPDGALLATGHGDRWVRVWDVEAGRELRAIDLYTLASGPVPSRSDLLASPSEGSDPTAFLSPSVGFSPDGRYLWTQAKYGDLVVWDLETTAEVVRAPGELRIGQPETPNGTVAFSPDGRYVAFGGQRYQIWDLDTRELVIDDPEIHNFFWSPVSFSRGGLVSDGVVMWNLHGGGRERLTETLTDSVATDLAFSPDGTRLAIVIPSSVLWWDVDSRELVTLADLLTSPPTAMAWAPDSRSLAVGSADGIVRIWDVDTRRVTVTIPAGQVEVIDLAFTQDGERLAVVTKDGRVALHIVRLADLMAFARTHLTVPTDEECRRYLHEPCPSSD